MSKLMEQLDTSNGGADANKVNKEQSGELLIKNIKIGNSEFRGLWEKDKGFSVGYENVRLTKNYPTLEEALNQIGYGVDNEDELVKVGECDYDMVVRVVRAILIVKEENEKDN